MRTTSKPDLGKTRSKTLTNQSKATKEKRKSAAGSKESPATKKLADETMQELIPINATCKIVEAVDKMQDSYCRGMEAMITAIKELSDRMDNLETILKNQTSHTSTDHVTTNDKDHTPNLKTADVITLVTRMDKLEESIRSQIECTQHTRTDNDLTATPLTQDIVNTVQRLEAKIDESARTLKIKEAASNIKNEHQVIWKSTMNKRKQCYWHALQNRKKADLYDSWRIESPDFLPLKYRPKINNHDCEESTNQKIEIARQQYTADISLMRHYSHTHSSRVQTLDNDFGELLTRTTEDEEIRKVLFQMWFQETSTNETISEQLWVKRQNFLTRKKEEEEASNSHQVTHTDHNRHQVKLKGPNKTRQVGPDPSSQNNQSWRR